MNPNAFEIPSLLMATATLTLSAVVALIILRWLKPASYRIHRAIWFAVLVNGIVLARVSIELPVLDRELVEARLSLLESAESPLLIDEAIPANTDSNQVAYNDHEVADQWQTQLSPKQATSEFAVQSESANRKQFALASFVKISWSEKIAAIWLAGMLLTLFVFILRYVKFVRSLKLAVPTPREWSAQNERVCQELEIDKTLPLLVHPSLGPSPAMTPKGYRILVPESFWELLTTEQRFCVLKHEYAHYRRSDIWKSLLANAIAIPHWFNPFAWLAVRRFEEAAEWACDQAVGNDNHLEKTGFARALLSLSTSNPTYLLGASGMATSNLSIRVQRLLVTHSQDTLLRRLALFILVGTIAALSWINVRLVAGPPYNSNPAASAPIQDEEEVEQQIQAFVGHLDVSEDVVKNFVEVLATSSGKVALRNRVSQIEEEMRRKAAEEAVPEFFSNLDADDHQQLLAAVAQAQQDIEELATAMTGLSTRLNGTSDADKMLIRFLNQPQSPQVFYFSDVREQMRPGRARLMQRLGRFLADDGNGKLIVRESARDELEQQIKNINKAQKHVDFMNQELQVWAEEINEKDELHKQIKTGLAAGDRAVYILAALIQRGQVDKPVERYFEFLEQILVDGPQGLEIPEERRESVEQGMAQMQLERDKLNALRKPIGEIANSIAETGDTEKLVKDFLKSELGKCMIIKDFDYAAANANGVIEQIKAQVMKEDGDNLVIREDASEQVINFVKGKLRDTRRFRRQTRVLDPYIDKLDQEFKPLYDSLEGRALTIEAIKELVAAKQFDAWPIWIDEHFEKIDGKYAPREGSLKQLQEIIQDTQEIEQELEKDDF